MSFPKKPEKDLVEVIADVVLNTKYLEEDLEIQKEYIMEEVKELKNNPEQLVPELLHKVAFTPPEEREAEGEQNKGGKKGKVGGLGTLVVNENVKNLGREEVLGFTAKHFVGSNMTFSACGYEHEEMVDLVSKHFSSVPKEGERRVERREAVYYGGERVVVSDTFLEAKKYGHVALAFPSPSLSSPLLYASTLLMTLLGGGSSFSTGGPGKGMYTRLYHTLSSSPEIESINSFNTPYVDSSLFGVYATCPPDFLGDCVGVICEELASLATNIHKKEFERAKNSLKSTISMNLESRLLLVDDMAMQTHIFGSKIELEEHFRKIDLLTIPQVLSCASQIISSPPSLVAIGNEKAISTLPSLSQIQTFFSPFKSSLTNSLKQV